MNTTLKGPAGPITTTQRVAIEFRLNKLELDFSERYRRGVAEVDDTLGIFLYDVRQHHPTPRTPLAFAYQ